MINIRQMDAEQKAPLQDQKGNIGEVPTPWAKFSDFCKRHSGMVDFVGVAAALVTGMTIAYNGISSRLDNRFADIEDKFSDQLSAIGESTRESSMTLVRLDEGLDHLKGDVSDLKKEVSDIKSDVSKLQSDVSVLRNDVNRIEENTKPNHRSENVAFFSASGY